MRKVLLLGTEYNELYRRGGDSLVALFCHLRIGKGDRQWIKPRGREGTLKTLERISGVSRNTLKRYVPVLIDMGFVYVQGNGRIEVRGRRWSKKRFKGKFKLVPVYLGKNFTETKAMSGYVRVRSNIDNQQKQIDKKIKRIERLMQAPKRNKRSLDEVRVRKTTTLSNQGFADLLKGLGRSKNTGKYHKQKLIKFGLLSQVRELKLVFPGVKSLEFLRSFKSSLSSGGCFVGNSGIWFESSPVITCISW